MLDSPGNSNGNSISTLTWKIGPEGEELLALDLTSQTLDEVSRKIPQGVYTTFRTYQQRTRVLGLQAHLERLEKSAAHYGWREPVDRENLMQTIRRLLEQVAPAEGRIRLTLDTTEQPGSLYVSLQPLHPLSGEVYEQGVAVLTSNLRREMPEIKSTSFISTSRALKASMPANIFERLLLDENGCILEGLTSNFFGVIGGALYTAACGVLQGITRSIILQLAETDHIAQLLRPVCLEEIQQLSEAFLTSSSRGIIPVIEIDDQDVGGKTPGPLTRRLMQLYREYLSLHAEPI